MRKLIKILAYITSVSLVILVISLFITGINLVSVLSIIFDTLSLLVLLDAHKEARREYEN